MKKTLIFLTFIFFTVSAKAQVIQDLSPKDMSRFNTLQFSGLFGSSKTGLGIKYKSIYRIKPLMYIGWGIGIDSYDSGLRRNFVPVSLEIMGDLLSNGVTPFYMLSTGYGISLGEDINFAENSRGGLMVDFSIGVKSKKHDSQPYLSFGYRIQNAFYAGQDNYGNIDKDVIFKRWNASAGLLF